MWRKEKLNHLHKIPELVSSTKEIPTQVVFLQSSHLTIMLYYLFNDLVKMGVKSWPHVPWTSHTGVYKASSNNVKLDLLNPPLHHVSAYVSYKPKPYPKTLVQLCPPSGWAPSSDYILFTCWGALNDGLPKVCPSPHSWNLWMVP